MAKRGRKSAAEKEREVMPASLVTGEFMKPPRPPEELTEEQQEIWQFIVRGLPADWFTRENYPLLVQYCRHISRTRMVSKMLDKMEQQQGFIIKDYRDLLRTEDEQSKAISSLATKMRLTQQTTYDKSKKRPSHSGRKPWENAPWYRAEKGKQ